MLAGMVGSVASLASLVSYPALLALGLPPVSANVTNTVALVFTGAGSAAGARQELAGQGRPGWRAGALAAGGGGGRRAQLGAAGRAGGGRGLRRVLRGGCRDPAAHGAQRDAGPAAGPRQR